jgi:hypothetical protein
VKLLRGVVLMCLVLASMQGLLRADEMELYDDRIDTTQLDDLLKKCVKDERVDYQRIAAEGRGGIDAYLAKVAQMELGRLSQKAQLATYINLYNVTVIKAVIDRHHAGYSVAENDFAVFKETLVNVGGKMISLNDLENKIIRPTFKDPRVHAALVCGARSCAPLMAGAYRRQDLDRVLDEQMKRFVMDPVRNPIDLEKKQLKLSPVFEWYSADFGGPDGVKAFVGKYLGKDVSDFTLSFAEYSWELNEVTQSK